MGLNVYVLLHSTLWSEKTYVFEYTPEVKEVLENLNANPDVGDFYDVKSLEVESVWNLRDRIKNSDL